MTALQSSKLAADPKIINLRTERLSLTTFKLCSSNTSWPRARTTNHRSATRVRAVRG
jgi:hypothetical protein